MNICFFSIDLIVSYNIQFNITIIIVHNGLRICDVMRSEIVIKKKKPLKFLRGFSLVNLMLFHIKILIIVSNPIRTRKII